MHKGQTSIWRVIEVGIRTDETSFLCLFQIYRWFSHFDGSCILILSESLELSNFRRSLEFRYDSEGLNNTKNYIKTEWVTVNVTVRIEYRVVAFVGDLHPIPPSLAISGPLIFLVGRVLIDEIANVFIDHGADPSVGGGIELEPLFLFAFECSNFDLFTGNGAIDLKGRWLFDDLRGESLFGRSNYGKGIGKVVLRSVVVAFLPCFHVLKLLCLDILFCSSIVTPWSELPQNIILQLVSRPSSSK